MVAAKTMSESYLIGTLPVGSLVTERFPNGFAYTTPSGSYGRFEITANKAVQTECAGVGSITAELTVPKK